MEIEVIDSQIIKTVRSPVYNMVFKKYSSPREKILEGSKCIELPKYDHPDIGEDWVEQGSMARWGKNFDDDPLVAPGPEIGDVEISAGKCCGIRDKEGRFSGCRYCYKGNAPGKELQNMTLETYKVVLDKLMEPGCLSQIALGITGVKDNPDLLAIMRHTKGRGVFPNFTLTGADLDYEMAYQLADLCGALAVSCSPTNPDLCFDTVALFNSLGVAQTNIHIVVAEQTLPFIREVMIARKTDPRLKNLNAIVGLLVKPKGRAKGKFLPPTQEQYEELVAEAIKEEVPFGMDSCSCPHFIDALDILDLTDGQKKFMVQNSDPCESMCFSIYVDATGQVWPCSFCEDEPGFKPINLLEAEDFSKEVWFSDVATNFRKHLWENGRRCPAFSEVARLR